MTAVVVNRVYKALIGNWHPWDERYDWEIHRRVPKAAIEKPDPAAAMSFRNDLKTGIFSPWSVRELQFKLTPMAHLPASILFKQTGSPDPVDLQSQSGPNPEFVPCCENFGYPTATKTSKLRTASTNPIPTTSPSLGGGHGHFMDIE
jgi:hypothetical protein